VKQEVIVRRATVADAPVLARHRTEMFKDMGELPLAGYTALLEASREYFVEATSTGRYWGWVAVRADRPEEIVAGVGVLVRERVPSVDAVSGALLPGSEAYVLNVFTEKPWRRHGVAGCLMTTLIAWARGHGMARLRLHASVEGRGLYEKLGFIASNEMCLDLTRRTSDPRE
jgi:GNAT superfamily N-acetyltransferase